MDGMNEQERAIAWFWAIEALASFKEVDVSLLHDLIEMAPPLPDDMGKNAKERVALRCLEGFFGTCNVMSSDVPSAQNSKVSFDFSESCENVLKRIVDETPESDLRMAGPGLLKWDIQPFIMHKRGSLPKCALKQLKESILDGTHPHAALLRGKSGLTLSSDGDRVPVNDSNPRLNENYLNAPPNTGVKGYLDPLVHMNESKLSEEDQDNTNLLPSKRDRIALNAENMADENRSSLNDSDDLHRKAKKMVQDASYILQSTEQNQIPLHGKELLKDSTERERCDLAENQMGMMEEGTVLEDGHDDYTASKRRGKSSGDAIYKSQSENHFNATSMRKDTFRDEAHQNSCVDQAKDDGGLHHEPRTSGVAPADGTQHKVSAKVFNCNSEHNFHIKAPHYVSANGPQEKSIADGSNGSATENPADENRNSVIGFDDCFVTAKKMKWDASYVLQSIEKNQIPLHGRQLSEDSSERDVPISERERSSLAKNQMGMMDEDKGIADGHDDYTASNRCGQSTDDAVHKSQSENRCNASSMPQDSFQDEVPQYTYVDRAKDDGLHPESRVSCVAVPDETQPKVSAEVFNCNSEQNFHIKVSHPASANEPQQRSISGEGKDNSEHRPEPRTSGIASLDETQHKGSAKASDSSSEHDSNIKVVRPASADGSQQKSIADEAKELMDWLRHYDSEMSTDIDEFHDEKIDVVMKNHAFLRSQCSSSHHSSATTDWTEKTLCKKCNEGRQLMCKTSNCPVEVHENWLRSSAISYERDNFYCPFCSYSRTLTEYLEAKKGTSLLKKDLDAFIHTLEHQPKERIGRLHNKENIRTRNFDEAFNEKSHQNGYLGEREENLGKQCEVHVNQVNDFQFPNIIFGNEQQVAPSASCIHVSSECGDKSATAVCRKLGVSTGEKKGEEKVVKDCLSVGGFDGCQNQVPGEGDTSSSKNTESLLVDQGKAVVTEQEDQQHITNAPEEQGHHLNIDSEQVDQRSSTSSYSLRLRRNNPSSYPATPNLRRIKVPWTVEEEEMLKKGVQTYARVDEKNIPWKQILEFGGSVFLHSRTQVDLKDKWRNICRRKPKLI